MTTYSMTEPQAFRWIQRTAMDHRLSMREVSERILAETDPTGPADPAAPPDPATP
jgi:response regulator NasT